MRRALAVILALAACGEEKKEPPSEVHVSRQAANHMAAIVMLRTLLTAQAQFQAVGFADEDGDGVGEYGTFRELSGSAGVRGGRKIEPPVLAEAYKMIRNGRVERAGYYLRLYLPGKDGAAVSEPLVPGALLPDLAETTWCCYAWPVEHGVTGTKTFFINQFGDILGTDGVAYSGDKEPPASAAFRTKEGGITADAALDGKGTDGAVWKPQF